jgi:ribosomal protein S18 acetylase RimI-like enzyme
MEVAVQVTVRPALRSDVKALSELADKLIPGEARKSDRMRVLTQSLRKPNHYVYVAEKDDRLVAFVDLWIFSDFTHAGRMGIIQNLFVDREVRRRGIGDLLMKEIMNRASRLKLKELHVWTSFENRPAISLYRKHRLAKRSLLLEREFER